MPAVGGPRVLGVEELERVRDALHVRLRDAEAELARQGEIEEANRGLLESMIAEPERYRWVRVAAEDVGEPAASTGIPVRAGASSGCSSDGGASSTPPVVR